MSFISIPFNVIRMAYLHLPPLTTTLARLRLCFGWKSMPFSFRRHLFVTTFVRFAFLPFFLFFGIVDEIFFYHYHNIPLLKPVFVASTPRTGSTNLTDAIAMDTRDFVSPTMGEVLLPYISLHYFVDLIEYLFRLFHLDFRKKLDEFLFFLFRLDKETLERHPMGFFDKGQIEFLVSNWLWVGPSLQFFVPSVDYYSKFATLSHLSSDLKWRVDELTDYILRKALYRHGRISSHPLLYKRALIKTHSADYLKHLMHRHNDASFVFCHRLPSAQISSVFGLFETAAKSRLGRHYSITTPEWVAAQFQWLQHMWSSELQIFHEYHSKPQPDESLIPASQRISIQFDSFISQFEMTMTDVFHFLGYDREKDNYIEDILKKQLASHQSYKKSRSYQNPTLDELGLDAKKVDDENSEYIRIFISHSKKE
jgi:hypothetical protein